MNHSTLNGTWPSLVSILLLSPSASVWAQPFLDTLTQLPRIASPERGSLAGQYAKTAFGPSDLARGGFSLPSSMVLPSDRGPLVASPFPYYSAENGISEWGSGWQSSISISRWRPAGDLDFSTDDLTSPWGHLVQGTDGKWYPAGMQNLVRLEQNTTGFTAYLQDGSRWSFGGDNVIDVGGGRIYSWYLSEAQSATGRKTQFVYLRNPSGRLFLSGVAYGGVGSHFPQYQLQIDYELLASPRPIFADYRSTKRLELDRRVQTVTLRAKNNDNGQWAERWHYQLGYTDGDWGPGFFLTQVSQTFASGEAALPVRYNYHSATQNLSTTQFREVPKLQSVLHDFGADLFQPNRSTPFDVNEDSRVDLEHSARYSLLTQGDDDFSVTELSPPDPQRTEILCRRPPSPDNPPRHLAQMVALDHAHQVVSSRYWGPFPDQTDLIVCNREGQTLFSQRVQQRWELGPNTKLVDLNRDHQPDWARVDSGQYTVIPNQSFLGIDGQPVYGFGAPVTGTLVPARSPDTTWFQDFNGDGIPDLIVRSNGGITVWFGMGNFQFESPGQDFPFRNRSGYTFSIDGYQVTFVDANKDGLVDIILSDNTSAALYVNTGFEFRYQDVPGLTQFFDYQTSAPVFGDLLGSGNSEVAVTKPGCSGTCQVAYSLALDGPQVGLLASADDGKGTALHFTYARGPVAVGTRHRQAVLQSLTVESSGRDPARYSYTYQSPTLHTVGQFLVGFGHVEKIDSLGTEARDFLNGDTVAGLPTAANRHDVSSPLLEAFESWQYQLASFYGIQYQRLQLQTKGWRIAGAAQEVSESTSYLQYEADFCPQRVLHDNGHGTLLTETMRSSPSDLQSHLHCLEQEITLTGTHPDSNLDFRHKGRFTRNSIGLLQKIESIDAAGVSLTLQEVFYNPDYTIDHVSEPGQGLSFFSYDPNTSVLKETVSPDLTVTTVTSRHPTSDGILALEVNRGAINFTTYFAYDGQERLGKSWDDLGGSSESPKQSISYRYATATQPASAFVSTLLDAQAGIARDSVEFMAATGEAFTRAKHIPQGWAFFSVIERKTQTAETNGHLRPTLDGSVDVLSLEYPAFFAGADQVAAARDSSFAEVEKRVKYHPAVERQLITTLTLGVQSLDAVTLENGTYQTTQSSDAAKRVVAFEDEGHARYLYSYDALGRLVQLTLPNGSWHKVAFDQHGRVAGVERLGIAAIDYTYDPDNGRLTRKRFSSSPDAVPIRQVEFQYDPAGRKKLETHTNLLTSGTQSYVYYYDGATPDDPNAQTSRGLLTAVVGDGYTKTLQYRADGRLIGKVVAVTGWRTVESHLDYFEDGSQKQRNVALKDGSGAVLSTNNLEHVLEPYGRVDSVNLNGALLARYAYDQNGQFASATFVNGDTVSLQFDGLTRQFTGLTQAHPAGPIDVGWSASDQVEKNDRGLLDHETISLNQLRLDRTYQYSPPGFLSSAQDSQHSYAYGFDTFGLPSSITENGIERDFVETGDVLTVGGVTYRFDGLRRTVQKGDLSFAYGPNGQIQQAQRGSSAWTFLYDESGERLVKLSGGVPVAGYFEEGFVDGNGLTGPLEAGGSLVGVLTNGQFQLVPADTRGTVIGEFDGTDRVPSPFGNRDLHPQVAAAVDYVQRGFDQDLGLVRMGERDYDPFINRFLTADPLFLEEPHRCVDSPLDCNLYSYAHGAPTVYRDPDGRCPICIAALIGAAVGAATSAAHYALTHKGPFNLGKLFIEVGAGAAEGAITGAVTGAGGLTDALHLTDGVLKTSLTVASSQLGSLVQKGIKGESLDWKNAVLMTVNPIITAELKQLGSAWVKKFTNKTGQDAAKKATDSASSAAAKVSEKPSLIEDAARQVVNKTIPVVADAIFPKASAIHQQPRFMGIMIEPDPFVFHR